MLVFLLGPVATLTAVSLVAILFSVRKLMTPRFECLAVEGVEVAELLEEFAASQAPTKCYVGVRLANGKVVHYAAPLELHGSFLPGQAAQVLTKPDWDDFFLRRRIVALA